MCVTVHASVLQSDDTNADKLRSAVHQRDLYVKAAAMHPVVLQQHDVHKSEGIQLRQTVHIMFLPA